MHTRNPLSNGAVIWCSVSGPSDTLFNVVLNEVFNVVLNEVKALLGGQEAMTTLQEDQATVVEATERDLEEARDNALRAAGVSLDELRKQARTGHFESVQARLAWIVVSGLPAV